MIPLVPILDDSPRDDPGQESIPIRAGGAPERRIVSLRVLHHLDCRKGGSLPPLGHHHVRLPEVPGRQLDDFGLLTALAPTPEQTHPFRARQEDPLGSRVPEPGRVGPLGVESEAMPVLQHHDPPTPTSEGPDEGGGGGRLSRVLPAQDSHERRGRKGEIPGTPEILRAIHVQEGPRVPYRAGHVVRVQTLDPAPEGIDPGVYRPHETSVQPPGQTRGEPDSVDAEEGLEPLPVPHQHGPVLPVCELSPPPDDSDDEGCRHPGKIDGRHDHPGTPLIPGSLEERLDPT